MVVMTVMVLGMEICFGLHILNDPLMLKFGLRIFKILFGANHVRIKMWCEVIHGIFGLVVMFLFPGRIVKFMTLSSFRNGK